MTLQEASKRFAIPIDELRKYEENGLLQNLSTDGQTDGYADDDFRRLSLVQFLLHAGFSVKEAKKYLELMKDGKANEEQIRMLRKQRFEVLEGIHEKQQVLDQLDYMILEKKNKKGLESMR